MFKSAGVKNTGQDPEGRMPLAEHLRELRNRLAKSLAAIAVVTIVSAFFYNEIIEVFTKPVFESVGCEASFMDLAKQDEGTTCARITINGLLTPFTLALKVALMSGLVLASPVWLYQLWGFLAPGLHSHEKKYGLSFVAAGFPLFLMGGFFAYSVLPTTARVLIDFTPFGVDNLLPLDELLDLITRMVVVFGLAFELPLLLVLLNFGGVISAQRMRGWWRGMVMGVTLFSAIATPSTDPLTMLALAVPILLLYGVALLIAAWHDRRAAKREAAAPDDDEASELGHAVEPVKPAEPVAAGPSSDGMIGAQRDGATRADLDDAT